MSSFTQHRDWQFFLRGQRVNILDFMTHVSVTTTQLCSVVNRAATDNT